MGSLVNSPTAFLLTLLLTLLFGVSIVLGQDLRERDALCSADGCFVIYFQRKTFLDSWRACKEKGGNLATIKRKEDATTIASLFSTIDLRHSRTKVRVWIGLQRQPRQCTSTRPLRGFSWTTGDQDTDYTNWQKEDSTSICSAPRCVVMSFSTQEQTDNFKWLDGSCSVTVDGYLCHYAYKGMCTALKSEGAGNTLYTTPFNLLSTLLTHVPFGSVAAVPCPSDTKEEQSVLCMLKDDGSVGWSRDSPICSDPPVSHNWCDQDNGGCDHFCRLTSAHFYCECAEGYQLAENGQNCELSNVCQGTSCEYECLPLSDGYRCACPEGYMLAPDESGCLDVDECLQSPCEQICVNAPGTFECQCQEGYNPDDKGDCEDIDECINDPCEHACENTLGSYICHCHLGYCPVLEDTSQCQDIDECQILGTCEQMCVNYEGGFECHCEEGYELLSDHYSCRKRGEGYDQSAVTPSFPWITHQPGHAWNQGDYDWNQQQSHTNWPPENMQPLDWLSDPPTVLDADVSWVTSAHLDVPFDLAHGLNTQEPGKDENNENKEVEWLEWEQRSHSTTHNTTPPPATKSTATPDWYNEDKEPTAHPFLSTSTVSEGAWNWWTRITTSSQKASPEDSVIDHSISTDSSYQHAGKEQHPERENFQFPRKVLGEKESLSVPTHFTPFLSKGGETGDILDSDLEDGEKKQSSTWLIVGLLVPICIFIVVMVALGIVYCTHCTVQPRNKNATDCYHWISGAHDKQGAPDLSAGLKAHV